MYHLLYEILSVYVMSFVGAYSSCAIPDVNSVCV